jgi:hypothetical protein
MKNRVAALHRGGQRVEVEIVAAYHFEFGILLRAFNESFLAGGKIIPAHNLFALREQDIGETCSR